MPQDVDKYPLRARERFTEDRVTPIAYISQTFQARLPDDSGERKQIPMCTGLLDYFPDALAEVARVSWLGNEKHNPGQDLHWSRGKSGDHADCIIRHLIDRGLKGKDGIRHSAEAAWRCLALLQEEIEKEKGLPMPRAARIDSVKEAAAVRRPEPSWLAAFPKVI